MQIQQSGLEDDDPQVSYLLAAWARFCKVLGKEFIPYMPYVIQPLLQTASQAVDLEVRDADDPDAGAREQEEGWDSMLIANKLISIKTSSLEDKATACNMITCYVAELKGAFFPWVAETSKVMVPLCTFLYHDEVRTAAIQCMADLVLICQEHAAESNSGDTATGEMLAYTLESLIKALNTEPETEIIVAILEGIAGCINNAKKPLIPQPTIVAILEAVFKAVQASDDRRTERAAAKTSSEDHDEEDDEREAEENDQEDDLFLQAAECICAFVKIFGSQFMPYWHSMAAQFFARLQNPRSTGDTHGVICILDDMMEHGGPEMEKYLSAFVQIFMQYAKIPSADLRQAAVYGLGVCAQVGGEAFGSQFANGSLEVLKEVVEAAGSREGAMVTATENAISSVGKIANFQGTHVDVTQVWPYWLSHLPILADEVEGRLVHAMLCDQVEAQNPSIMGNNNGNVPKLVSIFGQVLGTSMIDEATTGRISRILLMLQSAVSPDVLRSGWVTLTAEQRDRIQAAVSSVASP